MAKKEQAIIIIKKKGGGHGGHHGGAWKVAYADFVTAMMCFFLVMWLMGSDDETKASIEHYFNHPSTPYKLGKDPNSDVARPMGERNGNGDNVLSGLGGANPEDLVTRPNRPINDQMTVHKEISEVVQEVLDGQAYAFDLEIDSLRFSVPENALFKSGTHELLPEANKRLDRLGQLFKTYKGYITIEGHTDGPSTEGGKSSYEASLARAVSVMNYMTERHWVNEDHVFPVGAGGRRGLASVDGEEDRSKNRRIQFNLSFKKGF